MTITVRDIEIRCAEARSRYEENRVELDKTLACHRQLSMVDEDQRRAMIECMENDSRLWREKLRWDSVLRAIEQDGVDPGVAVMARD